MVVVTPAQVAGKKVRAIRVAAAWNQDVLAWRLRRQGLDWTRDQVASLESLRRTTLELGEAVQIAEALKVPVAELFEGSGDVVVGSASVPLSILRDQLSGRRPEKREDADPLPYSDTERGWARDLGLWPFELRDLSRRKWEGRTVNEELSRLLSDPPARLATANPASQEAILMRELKAELRDALEAERL